MKEITIKDKLRIPRHLIDTFADFLKSPFPYYFDDWRKNSALTVGFTTMLVLLMISVASTTPEKVLVSGGTTFVILFSHIVFGPRIFPRLLDSQNWSVGKYMAFTLWQMIACAVAIPVVLAMLNIHSNLTLLEKIIGITPRVFSYGAIPLIISTLMLRNQMLKQSLRNSIRANHELDKIQELRNDPNHLKTNIVTINSETRETLELPLADLLFVEASDNYSTFHWTTSKGVEKKILRINLKSVELQLDNHFTVRCHRSFIVNLNAIGRVTGNANGYKLNLRDSTLSVPVSRAKGKEVINRIEHLRNVIEMN